MARHIRKGVARAYFCPTVASTAAPTAANVVGGTHLTPELAEIAGFVFENSPVATPDMSTRYVSQVAGEDTTPASSMTFYEDDAANPIRTALAKDVDGFILLFPYPGGVPASGDECEVWPVVVTSNTREWSTGNDPARYVVGFAITGEPELDAVVAA